MTLALFLCLICLGELAIFDFMRTTLTNNAPMWLLVVLPVCFVISILFSTEKKWVSKYIRRYLQLELFFIIGMSFYVYILCTTKQHPLVNFSYFMIYSMALSLIFIFREFSTYLYLLSCSLLVGVSQVYTQDAEESLIKAFIYLALLVLSVMLHSDFVNRKYTAKSLRTAVAFPLTLSILCVIFSLGLMTWMTHATPTISNYLESLTALKNKFLNKKDVAYKNTPTRRKTNVPTEKQSNQQKTPTQKIQNPKNTESLAQEKTIADSTQISLKNDLKFGDVNLDQANPYKLFEVSLKVNNLGEFSMNIEDCYWKVGHLDSYDAKNGYWYLSNTSSRQLPKVNKYNWTPIVSKRPNFSNYLVTQTYQLQNISRIFYLSKLGFIDIPRGNIDSGGNIFPNDDRREYKAISYFRLPQAQIRYNIPSVSRRYLKTPSNIKRYRNLALKWTNGARSPYEKAKMIEYRLRHKYTYDLRPGIKREDATYEFLFHTKRGYCQHFASAMTLLLRSIDIPARVAVGCRGGIWDEEKQVYIVSSIHRHAWVEVPFKVHGWVTFDPVAFANNQLSDTFEEKINQFKQEENIQNQNTLAQDTPVKKKSTPKSLIRETKNQPKRNGNKVVKGTSRKDSDSNKISKRNQRNVSETSKDARENQLGMEARNRGNFPKNTNDVTRSESNRTRKKNSTQEIKRRNSLDHNSNKNTQKVDNSSRNNRNKQNTPIDFKNQRKPDGKSTQKSVSKISKRENQKSNHKSRSASGQKFSSKKEIFGDESELEKLSSPNIKNPNQNVPSENTFQPKITRKNNTFNEKNRKINIANGLVTFVKNMAIFITVLLVVILFCYVVPQILKALGFLIKNLFKQKVTFKKDQENRSVLKKLLSYVTPSNRSLNERGQIIDSYMQLSSNLEAYGLPKKMHQTPTEYLRLLQQKLSLSSKSEKMTQLFLKAKFSPYKVKQEDVKMFDSCCEEILNDAKKTVF